MTRTKVSRAATKRGQNSSDSKAFIEMKLRDFDVMAECHMTNIELKYQNDMDKLNRAFEVLRSRIPKKLLSLTMGELRAMQNGNDELNKSAPLNQTISANMSALLEKSCRKKSKDDGYLTEESEQGDTYRVGTLLSTAKPARLIGPLMSAKIRRRSKSAGAIVTPHANRSLFPAPQSAMVVGRTQLTAATTASLKPMASASKRMSRSKQKTPQVGGRLKAISADRIGYGLITPKVQPFTPLALIRHAKLGESVFSVTGSPVVTANMLEATANINIPVANGMISIRPTELDVVDVSLVRKIDPNVLLEMKQLQSNLDKILGSLHIAE
ncbi:borealin-like isoform X1 [Anopheles bellator]|uniref:borealin-like isoform X1 n=1 Tax=Anopheles bellator TaxID=139047 RepID=UPI0026477106|nr:borealin-like isoform X1 [Anopheles bellator]